MAKSVCPVWVGYLLASPVRRWIQDPVKVLAPHVRPGMVVLEPGPGMGFFSLPLGRLVGPSGRVVCVDVQAGMLTRLERRARQAGLDGIVRTRLCHDDSLGLADLEGTVDFALAFAVVHETPDPGRFLAEVAATLRPGAHLLLAEPSGHVRKNEFARTLALAEGCGLATEEAPAIRRSHAALLRKDGEV